MTQILIKMAKFIYFYSVSLDLFFNRQIVGINTQSN